MDAQQVLIEKALYDFSVGLSMIDQGNQRCHDAKKTLESIYSPASSKKKRNTVPPDIMAKILKPKKREWS